MMTTDPTVLVDDFTLIIAIGLANKTLKEEKVEKYQEDLINVIGVSENEFFNHLKILRDKYLKLFNERHAN